ncbi:MAG: 50S ribosomal protein L9 [Bacilli bacterium]|nr:50S ribosomal protein L9 [Bacilli bacterium]
MKIILLEDIKKIGKKHDIVKINKGYACNYLIPKKKAVPYNKDNLFFIKKWQKQEQTKKDQQTTLANEIKDKLDKITLKFYVKKNPNGKMIGIISDKQIEEKLKSFGINIDKRKILDKNSINSFGKFCLNIKLYDNVIGKINVVVECKE